MASNDKPPSQPQPTPPAATPLQRPGTLPPYYSSQPPANAVAGPSTLATQFSANPAWKNGWTMAAYPYTTTQNITPYPQQQYLYTHSKPQPTASTSAGSKVPPPNASQSAESSRTKPPNPSPPPPEPCKDWDNAIISFLESLGLTQALRGFELDILVLNPDWEQQKVPGALQELASNIQRIQQGQSIDKPLEDRKLEYIHLSNGAEPRPPTSLNKSVSMFLAQKRANNVASNRAEFLRSLADQRAQADSNDAEASSSCARTDAKAVDRNAQIKYDIAKNEDGPLRRTMRSRTKSGTSGPADASMSTVKGKDSSTSSGKRDSVVVNDLSSDRHSGLDERLANIESHIAVRYVPHPPHSLLDRIRFLEDHIVRIEKDYPPWAALHFNQPNRNWPPPPKPTPIIVPPSLTRQPRPDVDSQSTGTAGGTTASSAPLPVTTKGRNSSLHRAVMERLEVQNAKNDLSGNR